MVLPSFDTKRQASTTVPIHTYCHIYTHIVTIALVMESQSKAASGKRCQKVYGSSKYRHRRMPDELVVLFFHHVVRVMVEWIWQCELMLLTLVSTIQASSYNIFQ